ncbi:MAG TPA: helix-turn-helix transcriptional regulator [Longimicrobiales bacterium]|nr:helix-turn-helix transcriptional regulator [Longimicrobiales bacterium]
MPPALLGQFEHQVLLAILRRGSDSYSVEIVQELERHTGREVATSAVFVALKRLEAKGLLEGRLVTPGADGGHARRYFRLTAEAVEAMRESRQSFLRLWSGVESALDEPGA